MSSLSEKTAASSSSYPTLLVPNGFQKCAGSDSRKGDVRGVPGAHESVRYDGSRGHRAEPAREGDLLGTITDPMSNARTELRSPYSGRIIGMARNQVVMPGFAAFHVGISSAKVPEDDPDPEPVMSRNESANDDYVDGMSEEE